ncbi:hypothetical protein MXD81_17590, partial [Microbacteriaceae bacterium K1510]|nr:hypothetical protein [Microbacteriaceae bacterium K1510]
MIVDFAGKVLRQIESGNAAAVPAEIEIAKLRGFRKSGLTFTVQMRSALWKQIYELWPDYPKNIYLEQDIPTMGGRIDCKRG